MTEWYIFGWTFIAMLVILVAGSIALDWKKNDPRN